MTIKLIIKTTPVRTMAHHLTAKKASGTEPDRSTAVKKQGTVNWFDVITTVWAIALVLATVVWVTNPAFARGSRGSGPDCMGACVALDKCDDAGGCFSAGAAAGECYGECGDGSSWDCGYGLDV